MKKLLYIILLLPLWVNAQTNGTIQKTSATGTIRGSFGSLGLDTLVNVNAPTNGYVPVYNSTLKKSVWTNPSTFSPTISFGTFGSTPNAQGGSYSGGVITLQPADATNPGGVSTTTQTIKGNKTIINDADTKNTLLTLRNNVNGNDASSAFKIESNGDNYLEFNINSSIWDGGAYGGQTYMQANGGALNISATLSGSNVPVKITKPSVLATNNLNWTTLASLATSERTATFPDASGTVLFDNGSGSGLSGVVLTSGGQSGISGTKSGSFNLSTSGTYNNLTIGGSTSILSLANNSSFNTNGAFSMTLRATANSDVTLPTTGTLYGTATGSITSSQLRTSLTDETGTGLAVFSDSPTLTTPNIGDATGGTYAGTKNQNASSDISISNSDVTNSSSRARFIATSGTVQSVMTSINGLGSFMGAASNHSLSLTTNGSSRITVSSSGAIQFNTYGAGTLTTDASGNITATSDRNAKEKFAPYTKGLSAMEGWKPQTYNWRKETGLDTKERYTSLIAQDVKETVPEAIGKMANGDLTVQERVVIATMVNAINELNVVRKEQQTIIEKQDARILELEKLYLELKK